MTSLYEPYKSIGFVCDTNPFVVNRLGEEIFITSSIGKCFQVFRFDKLLSCLVSQPVPEEISCFQCIGQDTFVAVGQDVHIFNRSRLVRTYSEHQSPIVGMISLGNNVITFDQNNNVKIWDISVRQIVRNLKPLHEAKITKIIHPTTYINKILIAFSDGQLELWNINKMKLIFSFNSHIQYFENTLKQEKSYLNDSDDELENELTGVSINRQVSYNKTITAVEQSPACDVVALGFAGGKIILINLKLDRVLFTFQQTGGAVTSITFRSDIAADRYPYMVSSTADGRLHIWNLGDNTNEERESREEGATNKKTLLSRKLQSTIEEAHFGPISKVSFLPGEPVMISSGETDNSIKVWIFDATDGSARLLRSREGHRSGGPLKIRYYGGTTQVSMRENAEATSCEIISAGTDGTLRLFNTALENQNRELSQKPILKKLGLKQRNIRLPECLGFSHSEARQRDWGNLVTIHKDHSPAYVWNFKHRVITDMILKQPSWKLNHRKFLIDPDTHSTAVVVSACGNFCVVGSRGGMLYKYNLQSGLTRGSFPSVGESEEDVMERRKKEKTPGNVLHEIKEFHDGNKVSSLNGSAKEPSVSTASEKGHSEKVTGLFLDIMGVTLVSCGMDGQVLFWDFLSHRLCRRVQLDSPQLFLQGFSDAGFVAFAGQDRVIRLFDLQTQKLARRYAGGHKRELTDLAFTPDGRRLLSSSGDCTLRIWDIPTGRCLQWLFFDAPVMSMAVSHSGEYLCLAQAEKQGVFMYLDRSLYETVHFWEEPKEPIKVSDSRIQLDNVEKGNQEDTLEDNDEDTNEEKHDDDKLEVKAAFTTTGKVMQEGTEETTEQRGTTGTITMAAVPRAYWTSLFHLEAIKKRNQPKLPPTPLPQAPFFLPSVVREGSAPSFPTPEEFEKMKSVGMVGEKKRDLSDTEEGVVAVKRVKKDDEGSVGDLEDLDGFKDMTSAWDDDDDDQGEDAVDWKIDSTPAADDEFEEEGKGKDSGEKQDSLIGRNSKILGKKSGKAPRCKLAILLQQIFSSSDFTSSVITSQKLFKTAKKSLTQFSGEEDTLMTYLKQLPPPAVDLELRALCNVEDLEGVGLIRVWLCWLALRIESGENFEILQAYLNRTMVIYGNMIIKPVTETEEEDRNLQEQRANLNEDLRILTEAHGMAAERFRGLIQKNLCLLKMFSGVPWN